jgi:AcrR family transcriptional regulator
LLDEHTSQLGDRLRDALESTSDNQLRISRSVRAYFDFVDDPVGAYQLVFESDLRNEPAVRAKVEGSLTDCVNAIAATIAHDTGYETKDAELLAVGVAGLAEVGARWWLSSGGAVSKEHAVELLVQLAWRGLSGAPKLQASAS